jgi:hypothetical protein
MGATQSIINEQIYEKKNNIYIPLIISNDYVDILLKRLSNLNFNISNSQISTYSNTFSAIEINNYLEFTLSKADYIIILISPHAMELYSKSFEMNILFNKNNIIYIMIDENFTPDNKEWLNNYIGDNKWYPLYNQETLENLLNNISNL